MHKGGGNYLKYLKRGWNRKQGRGNKDCKRRRQAGSRGGCIKKGGPGTPYKLWYIGKLILWSLLFFVIFLNVTVLKFHYVKGNFPKMFWWSAFSPISWLLPLVSVILYHYTWKEFMMAAIDISVNHIFHVTTPTIKSLVEVLHVWMKAFLVGFMSVISIYWLWIFYWYYTYNNSQNI